MIYEKNDSIQMQMYFHSTFFLQNSNNFFFFFLLPLGVSGKQVVNSTLVSALSDFHGAVSSLKKGLAAPIEWKEKNELT